MSEKEGKLKTRKTVTTVKELQCPREQSDMTPCICRDGELAISTDGVCVGCGKSPVELLQQAALRIANLTDNINEAAKEYPLYHLIDTPKFTDSTAPTWFRNDHPAVKNYPQYIIKSEVDQKESIEWFLKWFGTEKHAQTENEEQGKIIGVEIDGKRYDVKDGKLTKKRE